ncbi:2988_t:CDS:1, partial [Scutellospora calospora]
FTNSLPEYPKTIPTLWDAVKEFIRKYSQYIESDNLMEFNQMIMAKHII